MSKVIYATGVTGFIGQYFLKKIFKDYDTVLNFGRNKNITIYQSKKDPINTDFDIKLLDDYQSEKLVHLATYYNPKPKNSQEELQLKQSNFDFPVSLCTSLKKSGLKHIVATSSYMQLLGKNYTNLYTKTKSDFISWARPKFDLTEIFLFDTFGQNDKRNKVLDTFIKNAILNKDICVPSNNININLTHAFEVSDSIVNSLSLKPIEYMIKSDNQISIKKLAETVITQAKSSSKILPTFKSENLIDKIDHFPENIYINSLKSDFQEQIQERYNEIRKTHSF